MDLFLVYCMSNRRRIMNLARNLFCEHTKLQYVPNQISGNKIWLLNFTAGGIKFQLYFDVNDS
jgi:hypothetical protein